MAVNKVVYNTKDGAQILIDLTGDNVAEGKVFKGVIFHGADGNSKTGTFTIDDEISEQDDIISRIKTALQGKASGGGGGTTPTQEKTVDVVENGTVEVLPDAGYVLSKVTANVNVPIPSGYIKPSGTKNISANGTHNVKEYENVSVDVPIPDGYIKPSGTKDISQNGTLDVTEFASVNVNVPSETPNIQPLEITENGTYTAPDGVDGYSPITVNVESSGGGSDEDVEIFVDLIENSATVFESDRITKLAQYAFAYRTKLQSISLPNLKSSNTRAFTNCDSLVSLSIPNMTGYTYQYMAAYCGALKTADVKQASYISSYSFYGCANLTEMEFNRVSTIATNAFNGCTKLATLILRSDSLVTLGGTSAFTGTKIAGSGGYIYVPSALVDSYKAATNWSNYSAKIRAIEDYPEITGG